jgi:hypothetical protein
MARTKQPRPDSASAGVRNDEPLGRRSARLRLRAAWMYYAEDMTQSAIAEALASVASRWRVFWRTPGCCTR